MVLIFTLLFSKFLLSDSKFHVSKFHASVFRVSDFPLQFSHFCFSGFNFPASVGASVFHASALLISCGNKCLFSMDFFCVISAFNSRLTFPRYTRFGTKLALFFCLAKTSKYKTNFKLNQMPKSRVTCVMQRCDTSEKHQSSSVPIFQPNVSNFSTFQFWSLSIVGNFFVYCLSSELCFSIKNSK